MNLISGDKVSTLKFRRTQRRKRDFFKNILLFLHKCDAKEKITLTRVTLNSDCSLLCLFVLQKKDLCFRSRIPSLKHYLAKKVPIRMLPNITVKVDDQFSRDQELENILHS